MWLVPFGTSEALLLTEFPFRHFDEVFLMTCNTSTGLSLSNFNSDLDGTRRQKTTCSDSFCFGPEGLFSELFRRIPLRYEVLADYIGVRSKEISGFRMSA